MEATIFIVDDHPIFRQGLAALINCEHLLKVCGEAADIASALQQVELLKPELVILDLSLPDGNGLQIIKQLKRINKNLRILVASMHSEELFAERVVRAGAEGYIHKGSNSTHIIKAIYTVLDGDIYLSEAIRARILQRKYATGQSAHLMPEEDLSDREMEVFAMIALGMSSRSIAEKLHVSIKTIDTHKDHIKQKLGVDNSTSLLQRAIAWHMNEA